MLKRFIDEQATFEIQVPFTWKYLFIEGKIHTFQEYEIWKSDAFQLSINRFNDAEHKVSFVSQTQRLMPVEMGGVKFYAYPDQVDKGFTVKA